MKHNKTKSTDSPFSEKETPSPFGRGTSTIFHSEDDVLVYEDFIRKSRQLSTTSPSDQEVSNEKMDTTLATLPKSNEQTNQQTTMNNNQPQQSVNFEPEPFDSGISSHVPTDPEMPDRPETVKSGASMVCGTFNDLLTMASTDDNTASLSLREHMIIFLDDPTSSTLVNPKHDLYYFIGHVLFTVYCFLGGCKYDCCSS